MARAFLFAIKLGKKALTATGKNDNYQNLQNLAEFVL